MAMFNMAAIDAQRQLVDQRKYENFGGEGRQWSFPLLRPVALGVGNYRIRFLYPIPGKNPNGYVLVSTHEIIHDAAEKTPSTRVLGPESISDPAKQFTFIQAMLDTLDRYNAYERIPQKNLRRVIDKLRPWRRYWFPVLIQATEVPGKTRPDGTQEKPTYVPGGKWLDRILELDYKLKLPEKIFEQWRLAPSCAHHEMGHDFILQKPNTKTYEIQRVDPACPMDSQMQQFVADEYPDLPEKMEKFYYKEPEEVMSLIMSSYWREPFEVMGFKFKAQRNLPTLVGEGAESVG